MSGGQKALWTDEDFPFVLTNKATDFIEKNRTNPSFCFIHTTISTSHACHTSSFRARAAWEHEATP
jgi:hypothetical protein